jgi:hypothetical protein
MQEDVGALDSTQAETVQEEAKPVEKVDWLKNHVLTLQGLKKRTEQQNLLIELYAIEHKTPSEVKKFNAIVKAEKASDRAKKAIIEASNLIQEEKKAEKKAERKARDHELFNSAGLLILAGLVDTKTGKPTIDKNELLGALIGLSNVPYDHEKRIEWKKVGAAKIAEQK